MNTASLLEWQNLVFVVPFVLGILYYLLLASGTVAIDGDGDTGHGFEADDHGAKHTIGPEHPSQLGPVASLNHALSFLGIGRAPLSIVLTTFALVWGFVGYATNQFLDGVLPFPAFAWLSLLAAAGAAALFTRSFASLVARLVPRSQSYGISRRDLKGRVGEARFAITESFGSATVVDEHRFPHEVDCRIRPGEAPIPAGATVFLVEYDPSKDLFYVVSQERLDELVASR